MDNFKEVYDLLEFVRDLDDKDFNNWCKFVLALDKRNNTKDKIDFLKVVRKKEIKKNKNIENKED